MKKQETCAVRSQFDWRGPATFKIPVNRSRMYRFNGLQAIAQNVGGIEVVGRAAGQANTDRNQAIKGAKR